MRLVLRLLLVAAAASLLTTQTTGCRRRRAAPPPAVAQSGVAPSARITDYDAQRTTLARCASDPRMAARLTLRFVLGADGGVADTAVMEPPGIPPDALSCVVRTAAAFGFPGYANGVATMEYSFADPAAVSPAPPADVAPTEGGPTAPSAPTTTDAADAPSSPTDPPASANEGV